VSGCTKINTGALGNIVRQLHVHVVARSENDAGWPGPVWGYGPREPYKPDAMRRLAERVRAAL
jgi:diadenosine tetraphosphate (Ap4A) HIT family hydrolase